MMNNQKTLVDKLIGRELFHVSSDMAFDFRKKFLELPIVVDNGHVVEGVFCNRYQGKGYLIAPSPQIGCPVKCNFCNMSDLPYAGNLSPEIILEEIALILRRAKEHEYKVYEKPLKISFVKGGEGLLNPGFPRALELISENLPVPIKISTTFPDICDSQKRYQEIEKFAKSYSETTQMQISLISTDENYRKSATEVPLISFRSLRRHGETWMENVPNARKTTLSLTLTEDAPCSPEAISKILTPELFAIRVRDYMPNIIGAQNGIIIPTETKYQEVVERFRDCGYQIIPGKSGGTERKFNLTAGHIIKLYNGLTGNHKSIS